MDLFQDISKDVTCCQVSFFFKSSEPINFKINFSGETNPNDITSTLSSDGVLTITAPKKTAPPPDTERTVPIQQTGPSSKDTQPKIDHVN